MTANPKGALRWWHELRPDPDRAHSGDRAALARLRRCATVAEAMQEEATMALFRICGANHPNDLPAIALTAAVLAHVRENVPGQKVARQVGPADPEQPETALLKPLRFRRLMEAAEPDHRLIAFRRLVGLAGGKLNVGDLADALLDWSDGRRRQWTYHYWNADQPVTPSSQPAQPTEPQGSAA